MAREMKKSDVQKYMKQAGEFLVSAIQSYESERYNAATFNAIQAMLNANDALTINHLKQRASSDHREALALHASVAKMLNDNSQKSRLSQAMDLRSNAGYGPLVTAAHRPVPETAARPPPPNSQRFLMGIGFWAYANIRNNAGLYTAEFCGTRLARNDSVIAWLS